MSERSDDETVRAIAARHGFGEDAGRAMARAIATGRGAMAQFSHPELGGMGQWTRGGMLMIGEMSNDALKARVRALAEDLAAAADAGSIPDRSPRNAARPAGASGSSDWWPTDLGRPSASGSQNGHRYAVFADKRRLVVERAGETTVYDTGDHRIGGASQQQGSGSDLSFASQHGPVRLADLSRV